MQEKNYSTIILFKLIIKCLGSVLIIKVQICFLFAKRMQVGELLFSLTGLLGWGVKVERFSTVQIRTVDNYICLFPSTYFVMSRRTLKKIQQEGRGLIILQNLKMSYRSLLIHFLTYWAALLSVFSHVEDSMPGLFFLFFLQCNFSSLDYWPGMQ